MRSTGWGSRSQAPWHRGRCEWRGAGERLAGGPRLAAKRRVPGGDTWTPQERGRSVRESMPGGCARQVGPSGSGSFAGGYAGRSRVLMAIAPERWRAEPGVGNLAHMWGVIRHSDLSSVRPSSKDAEWGVLLAPRRSAFSEPRGVGGVIFPGELVCFPPPLGGPGTHVGWAGGGGAAGPRGGGEECPRGSRSRLPGTWFRRWSRTAGSWVCLSRSRHLRSAAGGP